MNVSLISPVKCNFCKMNACYNELPVCAECIHKIQLLMNVPCKNCGRLVSGCRCKITDKIRFLFFYGDFVSRRLVYAVKYGGETRLISFIAEMMVKGCDINPKAFDAVTYVPRTKASRRRYGYDQGNELARAISRIYGLPFLNCLERLKGGEQKLLSKHQRFQNIKNQFRLTEIPKEKYKRILLVDDVSATGATVSACAEILKDQVARSVVTVVMAKTNFLME